MAINDLSFYDDTGSCEGYVFDLNADDWKDYLGASPALIPRLGDEPIEKIGMLHFIEIEEDARCQGHGNRLLGQMLSAFQGAGAETFFLIASCDDEGGPDLPGWYAKSGFEVVHDLGYGAAVMIRGSEDLIADCREITGYVQPSTPEMA